MSKLRRTLTASLAGALLTLSVAGARLPLGGAALNGLAPSVLAQTTEGAVERPTPYLMEKLGRGTVAVRTGPLSVYVGWRLLGTDPEGVAFNLYRSINGGSSVKLNDAPIAESTNFVDNAPDPLFSNTYFLRPLVNGEELAPEGHFTLPALSTPQPYLSVPLQIPQGGTTPNNVAYTYSSNDVSVGDLDGDGEYEFVVRWEPSNSWGGGVGTFTGPVIFDAYELDGTRLWRISLGRNVNAAYAITQFIVYDLDGDGRAEVATTTSDGTVDGTGKVIGNPAADHRDVNGRVLVGPEFLTIFDGRTGAELASTLYTPQRHPNTLFPTPAQQKAIWGDDYGNRVGRFLAGVAYLDGRRPSLVTGRGIYTRSAIAAWDWREGKLSRRWYFDTRDPANPTAGAFPDYKRWEHMGNHQLSIADVDADGRDEVVYGAMTIDDDGRGLYSTGLGHGDALHVSDMDPDRPGLEVYGPHESPVLYGPYGSEMHDARTGQIIWGASGQGADVGRGVAMDIDPRYRGYEAWSSRGGLFSCRGEQISTTRPAQMNFALWWDGDLLREILDGTTVSKWNWTTSTSSTLLAPSGVASNNGTKANPSLSADILGDWREEVIWRASDDTALRIYTTTIPTAHRLYTLMHDRQYREAVAWQNVGYNQPPHPSFFLGDGMSAQPRPNIITEPDRTPPSLSLPGDITLEATSPEGATAIFEAAAHDAVSGNLPVSYSHAPGSTFPLGTTEVYVTATDGWGNTATGSFNINVRDTTAPEFRSLTASPDTLWSPNHRMVPVTLSADIADAADPTPLARIVSVASNEPSTGPSEDDLSPDWEITGALSLNLRAERAGGGGDRLYTITVESLDRSGNKSTATVTVKVPHNQ